MLTTPLIRLQRLEIFMVAHERVLVALALLDGRGDARPAPDEQPPALDAGQGLELLELPDKCLLLCKGDVGAEFEEYCPRRQGIVSVFGKVYLEEWNEGRAWLLEGVWIWIWLWLWRWFSRWTHPYGRASWCLG